MARNPDYDFAEDYVDDALNEAFDSIESSLGPRLLPIPIRRQFASWGCGHFGCVMPTSEENIVLKVTSDPHEAMAAAIFHEARVSEGVVKYHHLGFTWAGSKKTSIAVKTLRGYPIMGRSPENLLFLLWREEATRVGENLGAYAYDDLYAARVHTADLRQLPMSTRQKLMSDYAKLVEDGAVPDGFRRELLDHLQQYLGWTKRLGIDTPSLAKLSDALVHFTEDMGLLLSDVHAGNLGLVKRGQKKERVVTDPGVAIVMTTAWDNVSIPRLG